MTKQEMNVIVGLLHYLNQHVKPGDKNLDAEVKVTDSNGDALGVIAWSPSDDEYTFTPLRTA